MAFLRLIDFPHLPRYDIGACLATSMPASSAATAAVTGSRQAVNRVHPIQKSSPLDVGALCENIHRRRISYHPPPPLSSNPRIQRQPLPHLQLHTPFQHLLQRQQFVDGFRHGFDF
jgi:hypothetical protein